jgi:uncharacterized protein (DUF2147 family)
MQHRAFAPALGALAAVFMAGGEASYASAADPSGIWAKEDGSAKMEVKKCGRGICSKIVWLKNPEDSRGRPLRDARNENTSMRDRPIIGLPLFINMVAIDSSSWQGSVYNPEEGKVYTDVKVTLASRNQIVLKGCKAWLLCGEKVWTRSKLLPSVVKPEEQEPIEVKEPVVPEEPAPKAMLKKAAREPVPEAKPGAMAPLTVGTPPAAAPVQARVSVAPKKMVKSTSPDSALKHNHVGLGLVTTSTSPDPLPLSGDNVSSLIVMTNPDVGTQVSEPEVAETNAHSGPMEGNKAASAPAAKPKAKPRTQSAEATGPAGAAHRVVKPKPKPKEPDEVLPWLRPR